jgi:hypothetical protein
MNRSTSIGFFRSSERASELARHAAAKDIPVVVLGSIYTEGVAAVVEPLYMEGLTTATPVSGEVALNKGVTQFFLLDTFDATSVSGDAPVVVKVTGSATRVYTVNALLHVDYRHRDESGLPSEETVENEMGRAMLPDCPPSLLSLPRAIPKLLATIKAARRRVLVVVDPLPGPSVTSQLMLMSCNAVVVSFDGTRESHDALLLFLHLVPAWLKEYEPILKSHRPRIVVLVTDVSREAARLHAAAAAAERMTTRLFPSAVVVAGPLLAALLAHPSVFLGADLDEAPRRPVPVGRGGAAVPRGLQQTQKRKRIV